MTARERKRRGNGVRSGIGRIGGLLVTRVDARSANVASGGIAFYVLNRGVARRQLFEKPTDYEAFEHVLREALDESRMRVCSPMRWPDWRLLLPPRLGCCPIRRTFGNLVDMSPSCRSVP